MLDRSILTRIALVFSLAAAPVTAVAQTFPSPPTPGQPAPVPGQPIMPLPPGTPEPPVIPPPPVAPPDPPNPPPVGFPDAGAPRSPFGRDAGLR